ncbi:acyl-CoA thioesterase [Aestuariirhabdus sp. Z084]|uniref:acyl-CoA thioesterase n=1 Tax=Aestuariirhabdus haliotis TaxID=2918751 RepID=UPI00201B3676|nr:thioesterase family protein [Aestuariirhabdus haliotis]MCL6417693.1 acyl-CoA thioesterase [Aestuariirhabdus haliotis]MCL6421632.1 acyl-CoA thioesterase [Aestuariirhabdus haliotis]
MEYSNINASDPITIKRTVLFGDCDPEGIVYTPRFSYFALEATHEALQRLLGKPSIRALKKAGILTPVRAFDLEFLAPVTWDDELNIQVQVADIGQHSFGFRVKGYLPSNDLAFTAAITYVTLSAEDKKVIQVPESLSALLNPIR